MGILDTFKKRKEEKRAVDEAYSALLEAITGERGVTKEQALAVPSVSACIDIIAGTVSALPIRLYKKEESETVEVEDERTKLLNDEPGDLLTAKQMWRQLIEDYYLDSHGGNCLIRRDNTAKVIELKYIKSTDLSLIKNDNPIDKNYIAYVRSVVLYPYQLFRILKKTDDGVYNKSITEEKREILSASYYQMILEEALVRRGGNKKGFLQSERRLSEPEMAALREAYRNLYSNSSENVVVLNNGIKFQESSNTAVEMQLAEMKKTNADEICKIFKISPMLLRGNAQKADITNTIKFCIVPLLTDIECSLNRYLLKEAEKATYYFKFDTKELIRGDIKERYEAYEIGLKNHFLQADEVRNMEDMKALGFNFIELGLGSVLYDIDSKTIYTPNTNQIAGLDAAAGEKGGKEDIED